MKKTSGFSRTATLPPTDCTGTLPNTIKYYDKDGDVTMPPFQLDWEVSYDNGSTWQAIGDTKHTVYVTLDQPHSSAAFFQETLFYIACKQTDGQTTEAGAINGIWQHFTDLEVKRADGTPLTYYSAYNIPDLNSTPELLFEGTSRCEGWAKFFLDVLKMHGVQHSDNFAVILPIFPNDHGFLIKTWDFTEPGTSGNSEYPYKNNFVMPMLLAGGYNWVNTPDVTYQSGIPAQGNTMPPAFFGDHGVAVVNGIYYDPSYGQTYSSLQDMANKVIDSYWRNPGIPAGTILFRKKDTSSVGLKEMPLMPYEKNY